jgi:hypothetical protein
VRISAIPALERRRARRERADGVPLFVEELTKSVLESGLLREEADRYVLDGALPPFAVPTSLHDSLMARLDRLASVRLVAQIGSAIGREFSYELLHAVSRLSGDELQAAVARLVASELVFQRGTPPDAVYAFKHALVLGRGIDAGISPRIPTRQVEQAAAPSAYRGMRDSREPARLEHGSAGRDLDDAAVRITDAHQAVAPPPGAADEARQRTPPQSCRRITS